MIVFTAEKLFMELYKFGTQNLDILQLSAYPILFEFGSLFQKLYSYNSVEKTCSYNDTDSEKNKRFIMS